MDKHTRRLLAKAFGLPVTMLILVVGFVVVNRGKGYTELSYDRFEQQTLELLSKDQRVTGRLGTPLAFRQMDAVPGIAATRGGIPGDVYAGKCREMLAEESTPAKDLEVRCAFFIEGPNGKAVAGVQLKGDRQKGKVETLDVTFQDNTTLRVHGTGEAHYHVVLNACVGDKYLAKYAMPVGPAFDSKGPFDSQGRDRH